MTISLIGASANYTLTADATTGALSIASQGTGVVNGIIAELTGLFNGGATGSTGLSHTLMEATKVLLPAALETKRLTGGWAIPFISK